MSDTHCKYTDWYIRSWVQSNGYKAIPLSNKILATQEAEDTRIYVIHKQQNNRTIFESKLSAY